MIKISHTDKDGNRLPVTIFKNEKDGKVNFSMGINKKDADGNWVNGYLMVQFKKDLNAEQDLHNKDKIYLDNAILDFWIDDNKRTNLKAFIFDYTKVNAEPKENDFVSIDMESELPF